MHCLEVDGEVAAAGGTWLRRRARDSSWRSACPSRRECRSSSCQTRGGARIAAGAVVATVGEPFELFFRLSGPADARVLVEIYHQGAEADVVPCVLDGAFRGDARRAVHRTPAASTHRPRRPDRELAASNCPRGECARCSSTSRRTAR